MTNRKRMVRMVGAIALPAVAAVIVGVWLTRPPLRCTLPEPPDESLVMPQKSPGGLLHIPICGDTLAVAPNLNASGYVIPNGTILTREFRPDLKHDLYGCLTLRGFPDRSGWSTRFVDAVNEQRQPYCPTLSPDGRFVAYALDVRQGQPGLAIVDIYGVSTRSIRFPLDIRPRQMAWSPDGTAIAYYYGGFDEGYPTLGLAVTDLGGDTRVLAQPTSMCFWNLPLVYSRPCWSPDSKTIYFISGPRSGPLDALPGWYPPGVYTHRIDLATGDISFVSPGNVCAMAPDGTYILLRSCPSDALDIHGPILPDPKQGRWTARLPQVWKVDLPSLRRTVLPSSVVSPKLSPSGMYAVSMYVQGCSNKSQPVLSFYRTSDWKRLRIAALSAGSVDDQSWDIYCAWVSKVYAAKSAIRPASGSAGSPAIE